MTYYDEIKNDIIDELSAYSHADMVYRLGMAGEYRQTFYELMDDLRESPVCRKTVANRQKVFSTDGIAAIWDMLNACEVSYAEIAELIREEELLTLDFTIRRHLITDVLHDLIREYSKEYETELILDSALEEFKIQLREKDHESFKNTDENAQAIGRMFLKIWNEI